MLQTSILKIDRFQLWSFQLIRAQLWNTASSVRSLQQKELASASIAETSLQQKELASAASTAETRLQQKELAAAASTAETSLQQKELAWLKAFKPACSTRACQLQTAQLVIVSFLVNSFANFKKNIWQLSGMVSFLQVSFEIFSFQDRASTSTSSRTSFQLRCALFIMIVALAGSTPSLAGEGFQQSASPCGNFRQGELWATDLSRQLCPQQLPRAHLGHRQLPQHYLRRSL